MATKKYVSRRGGGPTSVACPTGEKLRELRRKAGLTQEELAGEFRGEGVSAKQISAWECGDRTPGHARVEAYAWIFHQYKVSFDELKNAGFPVELLTRLSITPSEVLTGNATPAPVPNTGSKCLIQCDRLPITTGPNLVVKRPVVTKELDDAWDVDGTCIAQIVADGGVGKTTLVRTWLEDLRANGYKGLKTVFGWAFYNQSHHVYEETSSAFLEDLAFHLAQFGEVIPDADRETEPRFARAIARAFVRTGGLILLDGVEPLQRPPHDLDGEIRDPGLATFLHTLRDSAPPPDNPNRLVVITTRWRVPTRQVGEGALLDLSTLNKYEGADLLRRFTLEGSDGHLSYHPANTDRELDRDAETQRELEATAEEFGGHPLALALLASYLLREHDGSLSMRCLVPSLSSPDDHDGPARHARRVMSLYDVLFNCQSTNRLNKACWQVLSIMSLFDRPADCLAVSKVIQSQAPVISEELSEPLLTQAVAELKRLRLLTPESSEQTYLDAHPLLRQHFGQRLRSEHHNAWTSAHRCMTRHFMNTASKQPATIHDIEPRYRAIGHGTRAEEFSDTLRYYKDHLISREGAINWVMSGTNAQDLAAIRGFFGDSWDHPGSGLSDDDIAFLLDRAGADLHALGRFRDAATLFRSSLEKRLSCGNVVEAAGNWADLSHLSVICGSVSKAIEYGERGMRLIKENIRAFSDDRGILIRVIVITCLADALHCGGQLEQALSLFGQAESIYYRPDRPSLDSVRGFQYCNVLLDKKRYDEVIARSEHSQRVARAKQPPRLIDAALDDIALGTAYYGTARQKKRTKNALIKAMSHLESAVRVLESRWRPDYLPQALLARARALLGSEELPGYTSRSARTDQASDDITKAAQIADEYHMGLYTIDTMFVRAEYYQRIGDADAQRETLARGQKLALSKGYLRRLADLKS